MPGLRDDGILEGLVQAVAGRSADFDGRFIVAFDHTTASGGRWLHHQVWSDGRLTSWAPGPTDDASMTIVGSADAFERWLAGYRAVDPTAAVWTSEGEHWSLPPSVADLRRTTMDTRLPGLSFTADLRLPDHPFHDAALCLRVEEGVLSERSSDDEVVPDVRVDLPHPLGVGYLLGDVPFRYVAASSTIEGNPMMLGCITGLLAPPAQRIDTELGRSTVLRSSFVLHALATFRRAWATLLATPTGTRRPTVGSEIFGVERSAPS